MVPIPHWLTRLLTAVQLLPSFPFYSDLKAKLNGKFNLLHVVYHYLKFKLYQMIIFIKIQQSFTILETEPKPLRRRERYALYI